MKFFIIFLYIKLIFSKNAFINSKKENRKTIKISAAKRSFIGGNWKCNGSPETVKKLVQQINDCGSISKNTEIVVAPPSLYIPYVAENIRSDVGVAIQNIAINDGFGAYTGEISAQMAKLCGVNYVIVGHSERRNDGETDDISAKKTKISLNNGLKIIFCIGEKLEERESGSTEAVLARQLNVLKNLTESEWSQLIIGYEPVWAIGTGKTAAPEQAQQTQQFIRNWISQNVSSVTAEKIRIIYGGSVKGSNCKELFSMKDIDGFLVGGASLNNDFTTITHVDT
eukprot:GHVL01006032.1.p1 GENE.GHVL01006032.1~~GHVL01006032.1.p1  ORF type:complete len:283 (-),score=61.74 GHVL01006032.1:491-1339(-)